MHDKLSAVFMICLWSTNVPPSAESSTIIIICAMVLVVILVYGCLVYFLRFRKRKRQHSQTQESTQDQAMVRSN